MGTHDEDTKKYFRHSAVRCVLAPRYGDSKLSWFRQQVRPSLAPPVSVSRLCLGVVRSVLSGK